MLRAGLLGTVSQDVELDLHWRLRRVFLSEGFAWPLVYPALTKSMRPRLLEERDDISWDTLGSGVDVLVTCPISHVTTKGNMDLDLGQSVLHLPSCLPLVSSESFNLTGFQAKSSNTHSK